MFYFWLGGEFKKKYSVGINNFEFVVGYLGGVKVEVNVNCWNFYIRVFNLLEFWGYYVMVRELDCMYSKYYVVFVKIMRW